MTRDRQSHALYIMPLMFRSLLFRQRCSLFFADRCTKICPNWGNKYFAYCCWCVGRYFLGDSSPNYIPFAALFSPIPVLTTDSPIPCIRKVSAGRSKTFTKLWRLYTVVMPRVYGCRGSEEILVKALLKERLALFSYSNTSKLKSLNFNSPLVESNQISGILGVTWER